jgi:predicted dehydrogenase
MNPSNRRHFLKQSGGALVAAGTIPSLHAQGANERFVIGIIGPGGMGTNHLNWFAAQKDVSVAYVCDPDEKRRNDAASTTEKLSGTRPKAVADMRRVFEDKAVDGVVIATPDHWHAPATILACDAGKHVYVEKPCSHNIREGRLMIEAARRNNRIVQVGTQSRSTAHTKRAMELLRGGAIGDVLISKAWNSQLRANIGHDKPGDPPKELDYDLWVGPAPMVPYQKNRLHSWWRWCYNFGSGDAGNDGVHDIDIARWGLGVDTHPSVVSATGGKLFFDDDQQFPDTMYVSFEYAPDAKSGKRRQLIYEHRIWSPYVQEGHENGNAFYGTKGMLLLGKNNGWKLFGERNELKEEMRGSADTAAHERNFLDCIRSGQRPACDIHEGHLSSALAHLANIAVRTGHRLHFDPAAEKITGADDAAALVSRSYRDGHWAVPKGV